jgi:ABC-type multidrug transport system permease subunit
MSGSPALPRWAYVAGRIGSTVLVVAAMTVVTHGLGVVAYGVHIYASTLPAVIVVLVLGTVVFTSLGIGIVRFIPNSRATPAIVNLTILPLTFISGIWFVTDAMPTGCRTSPRSSRSERSRTSSSTPSIRAPQGRASRAATSRRWRSGPSSASCSWSASCAGPKVRTSPAEDVSG